MSTPDYPKTRVNARIDQVAEEQLRYVTEHTQMNVTEALKASIGLLYEQVRAQHARPAEILARRPSFVAMGDSGQADVSEQYKSILAQRLVGKIDADR